MRCINPAQMMKGNRNFKSVAFKTAAIQISSNVRTATPVTYGFFFMFKFSKVKGTKGGLLKDYTVEKYQHYLHGKGLLGNEKQWL
jgi:hypothetical protein